MIRKFINKIWNGEGHEGIKTPANQNAEFVLMYNALHVGTLSIKDGIWKFYYSAPFKGQNEISTLIDFPDKNEIYESNQLWPFFSYRIPGLSQPAVQEIIKKDEIDENNEVELLKRFGKTTVYNPFKLNLSS